VSGRGAHGLMKLTVSPSAKKEFSLFLSMKIRVLKSKSKIEKNIVITGSTT
jgi:hypothetical protein